MKTAVHSDTSSPVDKCDGGKPAGVGKCPQSFAGCGRNAEETACATAVPPLVTVLMPCLNEARTLAACIEEAHRGCRGALDARAGRADAREYEILIADNGSTDGSEGIAIQSGARVVRVEQKGYGAALRGGISVARGKYIVMGDSDCSYDFGEVPRFLDKLEEGYDLVVGNRFAGGIMPGAMPWHHRYIGNPVLSGVGRLLYPTQCRDWHCGLRAFDRNRVASLTLRAPGMEFASELIIQAIQSGYRLSEIPVVLQKDGRNRRPHLRSLPDGLRHLSAMAKLFPNSIMVNPTRGFRHRRNVLLVVLAIFAIATANFLFRDKSLPSSSPRAEEVVLSDLTPQSRQILSLSVSNPLESDSTLVGFQTSCGCTEPKFSPVEFRANERKSIQIAIDTARMFESFPKGGSVQLRPKFQSVNDEAVVEYSAPVKLKFTFNPIGWAEPSFVVLESESDSCVVKIFYETEATSLIGISAPEQLAIDYEEQEGFGVATLRLVNEEGVRSDGGDVVFHLSRDDEGVGDVAVRVARSDNRAYFEKDIFVLDAESTENVIQSNIRVVGKVTEIESQRHYPEIADMGVDSNNTFQCAIRHDRVDMGRKSTVYRFRARVDDVWYTLSLTVLSL